MRYVVIYEQGLNEEGRLTWSAYVPDLAGVSGGETRAECERIIREAMELHLEGLREEGLPITAADERSRDGGGSGGVRRASSIWRRSDTFQVPDSGGG